MTNPMGGGTALGSAYGTIRIDLSQLQTDLQGGARDLAKFQEGAEQAAGGAKKAFADASNGAAALGLTLGVLGAKLLGMLRDATLTAARTQVLGTVLYNVGKQAGWTAAQLDAEVKTITKLGITTQEARQAIVQFIQAQLNVADAAKIARAAQDLAVISGQNSSEAFGTLTAAILTNYPLLLRQYGIVVSINEIMDKYARTLGISASAMTGTQRQQAMINIIMEKAATVAGSYEAAMGDVGKQLTSLPRYVEEARNALGEGLLPVLGGIVSVTTNVLKGFTSLGPGMQAGISTALGLATAFSVLGGALVALAAKWAAIRAAVVAANLAMGGMLPMLAVAAAVVTVIVALVAAHAAAQKALMETSSSAAATTDTYTSYRYQLDEAGASAYALSESLYALVKAQDAASQAAFAADLIATQKALKGLAQDAANFGEGTKTLVANATTMQLTVLQDREAVLQLGTALGMTGQVLIDYTALTLALAAAEAKRRVDAANEAQFERQRNAGLTAQMNALGPLVTAHKDYGQVLVDVAAASVQAQVEMTQMVMATGLEAKEILRLRNELGYTDREIEAFGEDLKITGGELDSLAESTGFSREQIIMLNTELGWGEKQILDYAAALKAAEQAQLALIGAWSQGLTGLGDFQDDVAQSAKDYKGKLADLNKDTGTALADINKKWQNALPDPTTVADRMEQVGDVWDEWGLRMQAGINDTGAGINSEWVAMLQDMGYITATDTEGIIRQLTALKKAFYEGKLPELIDKNAPEWKEWSAAVAAEQKKATDAVNAQAGERRAALDKERAEELAAQKAHYKDLLVQTALHIAEQSGALKTWAQQTQEGPYVEFYSNAGTVFDAIKNGMLTIDPVLAQLIGTTIPGLGTAFETATGVVKANALSIDDLMEPDFLNDLTTTQQQVSAALANLGSVTTMGPGAPTTGMGAPKAVSWIDEVMGLDEIPAKAATAFGPDGLSGEFTTAKDTATADAQTLGIEVKKVIDQIPLDAAPPLSGLQTAWGLTIDAMNLKATTFKDSVIAMLKGIVDFVNTLSVGATISWTATGGAPPPGGEPGFMAGGMVPGFPGQPIAATVHAGEMILNQGQQQTLARMFGMSPGALARQVFGRGVGGGASAPASRTLHTEFVQNFENVYVRSRADARRFGEDASYGAQTRLRAQGLYTLEGR